MRQQRRTRARTYLVAAVIGVAGSVGAMPAGSAMAATQLDLTVGIDGSRSLDDPVLMRVSVTADALIDGEIIAESESSTVTMRREVQIPAGTTKEFVFVMPTPGEPGRVEVTVVHDGDVVATESASASTADAREFVGVLPRIAAQVGDLPRSVSLEADLGDARFAVLTPDIIDLGSQALRVFDVIVAGAGALSAMTDVQRGEVLGWVSSGGTLLIDDAAALAEVPAEWRPGADKYSWADLGEVRFTDGAAVSGAWPSIIVATRDDMAAGFRGSEMVIDPQMGLARRAGLDLPSIAPLAIGLGIYALLLGPALYLVLRRMRRLTLAWVVIPLLAVVTAGGLVVTGGGSLDRGHEAASTLIQGGPTGGFAITNALSLASGGGGADVDLPAGWSPAGQSPFFGWGNSAPLTVTFNADGSASGKVALEATQASFRSFQGGTDVSGLTTTAALGADGTVTGTARNDSPYPMHAVAVFAGSDQVLLGDLEPGATADWSLDAPDSLAIDSFQRGGDVWGLPAQLGFNPADPVPAADDPLVEWGIWGTASATIDLFPPGSARVVGWTDAVPTTLIEADGSTATAVTSLAPIVSDSGVLNAATIRAVQVRGGFSMRGPPTDLVVRYLLPPGSDPGALTVAALGAVNATRVSFWDGAQWVDGEVSAGSAPVPETAVRDGVVLVKTDVDPNRGPIGLPTLKQAAS